MAQRLFLNFVTTNINANTYAAFSWGPFTGPHRLVSVRFDSSVGFTITQSAGIFTSNDTATPAGALPFTTPNGWTRVNQPAAGMPAGADEAASVHAPFLVSQHPPGARYDLGIDVDGAAFYLKAVIVNRTVGGNPYAGSILLEKLDVGAVSAGIEPRTQPGGTNVPTPGAAATLGQPGASPTALPAPIPAPAPKTPIVLGPQGPQQPPASTMPPFTVTVLDPFESARQAVN